MERQSRIRGSVQTEGDTLLYKITGQGTPLLLIAGGGGAGDLYLPLADALARTCKVITYDRRANAGSTMNFPETFDLAQQARDVLAVLQASGESSAFVFGNSSGAVIALEFARLYPEACRGVIAHEPPLAALHPDKEKWLAFFESCYNTAFRPGGPSLAATRFLFGIQVPVFSLIRAQMKAMQYGKDEPKPAAGKILSQAATRYLIKQELLPVTHYLPDISHIRQNKERYLIAVGRYALQHQTFLFGAADGLCSRIGTAYRPVSGHHGSFMDNASVWAGEMQAMLQELRSTAL